ncbi:Crp/Fnr family transcriptional regulator [Crossiella sp. SN42]|uniref:Crp/Fnr family transcriptional regulator n=1 Tax=Crossiella sp. SN42 TaxID=2944808 RepID=UPI00207D1595|nr:Crp/Fnr family transcriptional regulator [Crossiella sp. SN42]MCO1581647.1 Crp/Fnr family transcriptional regulator [Crossiella sp. SN42]
MHGNDNEVGKPGTGQRGLEASCLFRRLRPEQAQALRRDMVIESFEPDEQIFTEGEAADRLHVIGTGKVKIGRAISDRACYLMALLLQGDLVEAFPGLDAVRRDVTATAVTRVTTASIDRSVLRGWAARQPEIGRSMIRELQARLRAMEERRNDLVLLDVPGRLAKLFLEFAGRLGVPQGESIKVKHHLMQSELAELIGSSRETVNYAIAEFVSRGWILTTPRGLYVLKPEALARRAR